MGDLRYMSFTEAYQKQVQENEEFQERKVAHLKNGEFKDSDFFTCWYCMVYYKKVDWLKKFQGHTWVDLIWEPPSKENVPADTASVEATP